MERIEVIDGHAIHKGCNLGIICFRGKIMTSALYIPV